MVALQIVHPSAENRPSGGTSQLFPIFVSDLLKVRNRSGCLEGIRSGNQSSLILRSGNWAKAVRMPLLIDIYSVRNVLAFFSRPCESLQ